MKFRTLLAIVPGSLTAFLSLSTLLAFRNGDLGGVLGVGSLTAATATLTAAIAGKIKFPRALIAAAVLLVGGVIAGGVLHDPTATAEREAMRTEAREEQARAQAERQKLEGQRRAQEADRRIREKIAQEREINVVGTCEAAVKRAFQWKNSPHWSWNAFESPNGRYTVLRDWDAQNGFGGERTVTTKCLVGADDKLLEIVVDGQLIYSAN